MSHKSAITSSLIGAIYQIKIPNLTGARVTNSRKLQYFN